MRKKWIPRREYEPSKFEQEFESCLAKDGFTITGYKEYMSKTVYLIVKDEIEVEFHQGHEPISGKKVYDAFRMTYDMKKKLYDMGWRPSKEE